MRTGTGQSVPQRVSSWPPWPGGSGIPRRWWVGTAILVFLVFLVLLGLIQLPYVVFRPGPAVNTLGTWDGGRPLIQISGTATYPTSGSLDFTTVTLLGGPGVELSLWDFLAAWADPQADLRPRSEVFPRELTGDDLARVSKAQMVDAQQEAVAVALRATGRRVGEKAVVRQILPDSPAQRLIQAGDVIIAVNGVRVSTTGQVSELVQRTPAGKQAEVRLDRRGVGITVQLPTRQTGGRQVLGVALEPVYTFPVTVRINAGDVGGPSAGMMFALGVYDKVTPGPLTGGQAVAGTGTITSDGAVGRIDSIDKKLVGARQAGARWFLAPTANCPDVVGRVPADLSVVAVSTFDQARGAVEAIARGQGGQLTGCS